MTLLHRSGGYSAIIVGSAKAFASPFALTLQLSQILGIS